jgi:hypothetical protein
MKRVHVDLGRSDSANFNGEGIAIASVASAVISSLIIGPSAPAERRGEGRWPLCKFIATGQGHPATLHGEEIFFCGSRQGDLVLPLPTQKPMRPEIAATLDHCRRAR